MSNIIDPKTPRPLAQANRKTPLVVSSLLIVVSTIPACIFTNYASVFLAFPLIALVCIITIRPRLKLLPLAIVVATSYLIALFVLLAKVSQQSSSSILAAATFLGCSWLILLNQRRQRRELRLRLRSRDRLTSRIQRQRKQLKDYRGQLEKAVETHQSTTKEIEESRFRQHNLLTALEAYVFHKDLDGRFTFVSELFAKMLNERPENIIGRTDYDFFPDSLAEKYRHDDKQLLETGEIYDATEENAVSDEKMRYMRVRKVPLRDSENKIIGLVGMFFDITESFIGSLELQENSARKRALFSAAIDGILLLDEKLNVVEMNPAAGRMLGLTDHGTTDFQFHDLVRSFERLLPSTDSPLANQIRGSRGSIIDSNEHASETKLDSSENRFVEADQITSDRVASILNGIHSQRIETIFKRVGEDDFAGEMTAQPILSNEKRGWAVFVRDITVRRKNEIELLEAKQRAEEANVAKDAFLANVSHELRTPLTGIRSLVELIRLSPLNPSQHEHVKLLDESASSLNALIDDLLDFSKIDGRYVKIAPSEFVWPDLFDSMMSSLAARAQMKSLEVVLNISDDSPQYIMGDAQRLKQVFGNLFGNSIKFTTEGEIIVESHRCQMASGSDGVEVSITDTGIGVEADKVNKIFEPFQQADSSLTREYGGTGLGLSISKQLIEEHGGSIHCEPRESGGTIFRVRLPVNGSRKLSEYSEEETLNLRIEPNTIAQYRDESLKLSDDLAARPVWLLVGNASQRRSIQNQLFEFGITPEIVASRVELQHSLDELAARVDPPETPSGDRAFNATVEKPIVIVDVRSIPLTEFEQYQDVVYWIYATPIGLPIPEKMALKLNQTLPLPLKGNRLRAMLLSVGFDANNPPSDPTALSVPKINMPELSKQTARVLLVEDSSIVRKVIEQQLERLGHDVVSVNNGRLAVDAYKEQSFNVVFMDIQMPVLDGISATKLIRDYEKTANRNTIIIALTANAFDDDRRLMMEAGASAFLAKPVAMETLRNSISHALSLGACSELSAEAISENLSTVSTSNELAQQATLNTTVDMQEEFEQGLENLRATTLGDDKLTNDLLSAFCREVPPLFSKLLEAMEEGDLEKGKRASHTIKSNLRYFGVQSLESKMSDIEKQCRHGALDAARQNVDSVQEHLRSFMTLVSQKLPSNVWHG